MIICYSLIGIGIIILFFQLNRERFEFGCEIILGIIIITELKIEYE